MLNKRRTVGSVRVADAALREASYPDMKPIRLRVDLNLTPTSADFNIRPLDDRSKEWTDLNRAKFNGLVKELYAFLSNRPISNDGLRVQPDNTVFRSYPARETYTETPRSVAFYLGGSLRRAFPEVRFQVDPV